VDSEQGIESHRSAFWECYVCLQGNKLVGLQADEESVWITNREKVTLQVGRKT
jgi:hypothetical protein